MRLLLEGQSVVFTVENKTLQGTIERIIKVTKPFGPETDDPSLWTYHVVVNSNVLRDAGIYQIRLANIKQ